jgi:predicted O-methyltransferase YrrM
MEKIINKLCIIWRFLKARREVPRLCAHAEGVTQAFLTAFNSSLQLDITPEEKAWIRKIESLRKDLNASTTVINRIMFGPPPETQDPSGESGREGQMVTQTVGQICRRASRQYLWCLLLFRLIREFKPTVCLELGTCLGITASYQAAALKLNRQGRLITLEGDPTLAALATRHFQSLGLDNVTVVVGRFQDTLDRVLQEHGLINFVFFDGDKNQERLLGRLEQLYPFLSARAVLVFDDIYWSSEMERAWKVIERDERVNVSIDTLAVGVCLIDRDVPRKECFKIPIG